MLDALMIPIVVWLLINTIIAVIVSKHAAKRGHTGYFWIVFFLGVIGVLLYVADVAGSNQNAEAGQHTRRSKQKSGSGGTRTIEEEGSEVAVSAVYDELEAVGEAGPDYFIEHIYPVYSAGYNSGTRWWKDCISPRLKSYSEIEPPENEGDAWTHRRTKARNENSATDSWKTSPDTDFMHKELGDRSRGLYVEVTDGEKDGGFFVKEDGVTAVSYKVESENGEKWVANAKSYLQGVY
ncbi:hypothetical protein [Halobacterium sp. KA-6]|uniref:hypothetical protein n=1 Tax=Halobacterium sp. KA-6 TaxID=2896368 RepID=UPI001E4CF195|nr:hypothetical protein [Halobacterium sp. KA-6]MCD2204749.1 hypothetical protein [Halobacterium sp. KA-6]